MFLPIVLIAVAFAKHVWKIGMSWTNTVVILDGELKVWRQNAGQKEVVYA